MFLYLPGILTPNHIPQNLRTCIFFWILWMFFIKVIVLCNMHALCNYAKLIILINQLYHLLPFIRKLLKICVYYIKYGFLKNVFIKQFIPLSAYQHFDTVPALAVLIIAEQTEWLLFYRAIGPNVLHGGNWRRWKTSRKCDQLKKVEDNSFSHSIGFCKLEWSNDIVWQILVHVNWKLIFASLKIENGGKVITFHGTSVRDI